MKLIQLSNFNGLQTSDSSRKTEIFVQQKDPPADWYFRCYRRDANIYLLSLKTFENWNPSNGQNWWVLLAVTCGPRDQIIDEGNPRRGKTAELWPDSVWRATKTNYPAEMTTGKSPEQFSNSCKYCQKSSAGDASVSCTDWAHYEILVPGAWWRQAVMHCGDHRSDTKLIYIKLECNGMALTEIKDQSVNIKAKKL